MCSVRGLCHSFHYHFKACILHPHMLCVCGFLQCGSMHFCHTLYYASPSPYNVLIFHSHILSIQNEYLMYGYEMQNCVWVRECVCAWKTLFKFQFMSYFIIIVWHRNVLFYYTYHHHHHHRYIHQTCCVHINI